MCMLSQNAAPCVLRLLHKGWNETFLFLIFEKVSRKNQLNTTTVWENCLLLNLCCSRIASQPPNRDVYWSIPQAGGMTYLWMQMPSTRRWRWQKLATEHHPARPEAEFLDVSGTKVLRVFLLCYSHWPLLTYFTPSPPLLQKWFWNWSLM